jgi:asparagine synthase (glutamine-hydrolysing)
MCGIAGILSLDKKAIQIEVLQKMGAAIAHRGPDGEGFFINPGQTAGLAHRRLAIIDLSEKAAQPLHYRNRYTIIHNGEIYNYIELKSVLKKLGHVFQTETDTEVVVAAYAQYKESCLDYFDGMFAFAIWDDETQNLFIARDRFGEKPLYYYVTENSICFASEMKALWAIGIPAAINHSLMCLYLGLGYTNIPLQPEITFYKNIFSLPPAHFLQVSIAEPQQNNLRLQIEIQQYWDLDKISTAVVTPEEAIGRFTELFNISLKRRLRSDVAIGTSLSGGLDSSSIVAFLNNMGVNGLQTFSAIFPGFEKNEEKYIRLVNDRFGINECSIAPNTESFIHDFDQLIRVQEQPFISSSIYAQYKVFELAKNHHTTVLIDGQGADEILAGYLKYAHWYLQELWLFNRKEFADARERLHGVVSFRLKNKLAAWFPAPAANLLEKKAVSQLRWHQSLQQDYTTANFSRLFIHKPLVKKLNDILYFNTMQFGLEELLRYADKNAMAQGIEVRLPFLNHELVQFIFSLPATCKIQKGFSKFILRQMVAEKLPDEIVWRKDKIGYETPEKQWLAHPYFRERIRFAKEQLVANGILNKNVLTQASTTVQHWRWMIASAYLK